MLVCDLGIATLRSAFYAVNLGRRFSEGPSQYSWTWLFIFLIYFFIRLVFVASVCRTCLQPFIMSCN